MSCECENVNGQLNAAECSFEFGAASNGGCCAAVCGQQGACFYDVPLPNPALTATAATLRFPLGPVCVQRCPAARSFCIFVNANRARAMERFAVAASSDAAANAGLFAQWAILGFRLKNHGHISH